MASAYSFSTTGDISAIDPNANLPSTQQNNPPGLAPNNAPSIAGWLPSSVTFPDDPYYIRNSLLSPFSMKPVVKDNSFPNDKNGLFSSASGTTNFLPYSDDKYANVEIPSEQ
jgi:hypothetical protein